MEWYILNPQYIGQPLVSSTSNQVCEALRRSRRPASFAHSHTINYCQNMNFKLLDKLEIPSLLKYLILNQRFSVK